MYRGYKYSQKKYILIFHICTQCDTLFVKSWTSNPKNKPSERSLYQLGHNGCYLSTGRFYASKPRETWIFKYKSSSGD